MEAYADPSINKVTIQCSAQSAKTLTILVLLCWSLAEHPGNFAWVCKNKEESIRIAKMRLHPMLEACEPVAKRLPTTKTTKLTRELYMPGAYVSVIGSTEKAALQSTPYERLFLDEARSYPKGALEMVMKRVRSYGHNYTVVLLSTPEEEDDQMDRSYKLGTQERWNVNCRGCSGQFEVVWENLKYELIKDTDQNYLFDQIEDTIRIECPHCGECYRDNPKDRKYMSRKGAWVVNNPTAPSNEVSFTWGALLPYWANLRDSVIEFIKADEALKLGEVAPMRDHINETRGLPWTMDYSLKDTTERVKGLVAEYTPGDHDIPWEAENPDDPRNKRFIGVDVQAKPQPHFVYVVRACGPGGKSRLLDYGRDCYTGEDLVDKCAEWDVPAQNVVVDCAYNTASVYRMCQMQGFVPFRGVKRESFSVPGGIKSLYQWTPVDPAFGTHDQGRVFLRVLQIAKDGVLAALSLHLDGEAGDWQIHPHTTKYYQRSVCAFERRKKINKTTGRAAFEWFDTTRGEDHFADCECAILAACKACDIS